MHCHTHDTLCRYADDCGECTLRDADDCPYEQPDHEEPVEEMAAYERQVRDGYYAER